MAKITTMLQKSPTHLKPQNGRIQNSKSHLFTALHHIPEQQ